MSGFQALPPPPGGDESKGVNLLVSTTFTTILALITVVMRVYTRVVVIGNVGWDDYTIVIAMVTLVVTLGLTVHAIHHGLGRHMYYLSLDDLTLIGLEYHVIEIFYNIGTALIKISACLFLLRIMARGTSKFLHWFLYIMMVFIAVLCMATAFVILFQCFPVQSGWDPRVKGKCLSFPSILGVGYAQNAWSIVTDFVCAAFPIIIMRKLKMNPRVKLALYAVMSLGLLSAISCIIKLIYLGDLAKGDFTYNGINVGIWGTVEQNIGIMACSVPALQPLFKKYFDTRVTKNTSKSGTKNNAGLSSWKDSTANAFSRTSQRSRTFHSIKNDASSDSEERILPGDKAKDGITKTTDVELFYSDAGKTGPSNSGPNCSIEMV